MKKEFSALEELHINLVSYERLIEIYTSKFYEYRNNENNCESTVTYIKERLDCLVSEWSAYNAALAKHPAYIDTRLVTSKAPQSGGNLY
jgi:hypothetical protein